MINHTPGPWGIKPFVILDDELIYWTVYAGDSVLFPYSKKEDCQLMAAAPEMLSALEQIAESARITGDGTTEEVCNRAIWKAKGETE